MLEPVVGSITCVRWVRRAAVVAALVGVAIGLAGCTPEGLAVFSRAAASSDVPTAAARSVLRDAADDDFRLLGAVDDAKYYAVVLAGAAEPWCLLHVEASGASSATCGSEPRLVSYSSVHIAALSNERPDDVHDWREAGSCLWVAASP